MANAELHGLGTCSFTAQTRELEFHCLTCKSLIRGMARQGLVGMDAIRDALTQHSMLADIPVQLGVGSRTYSAPARG